MKYINIVLSFFLLTFAITLDYGEYFAVNRVPASVKNCLNPVARLVGAGERAVLDLPSTVGLEFEGAIANNLSFEDIARKIAYKIEPIQLGGQERSGVLRTMPVASMIGFITTTGSMSFPGIWYGGLSMARLSFAI